jgi:hypothetical protein
MEVLLRKGIRLQGAVVVMNLATAANAFVIFQQSNFPAQVGTKTFVIKRVKGLNAALANTDIHIGTGIGGLFVPMLPALHTINGMNFDFVEDDLPQVEFAADMTCYPDIATVTIQVEVEEIG